MHLTAAIAVVIVAGVLAWAGKISADIAGAVFTGVIGYIAGQARNVPRSVPTRIGDSTTQQGSASE
jgi:type IV secretory pathway VirB2 component (pilin)